MLQQQGNVEQYKAECVKLSKRAHELENELSMVRRIKSSTEDTKEIKYNDMTC